MINPTARGLPTFEGSQGSIAAPVTFLFTDIEGSTEKWEQHPDGMSSAQPRLQNVDVEAVLIQLASTKGGGGNWRTSVVDLLKLLDLDSSSSARKDLANELNVHAGADGSAEQNIALQKAVMVKIAENGGKVPDSLRH